LFKNFQQATEISILDVQFPLLYNSVKSLYRPTVTILGYMGLVIFIAMHWIATEWVQWSFQAWFRGKFPRNLESPGNFDSRLLGFWSSVK